MHAHFDALLSGHGHRALSDPRGDAVGQDDHVGHHVARIVLLPDLKLKGVAFDEAGVDLAVCISDQPAVGLDGGDRVPLVGQALGQVVPHPAEAEDQNVFKRTVFFILHEPSGYIQIRIS